MKKIYFDHSATCPVDSEVAKLMMVYMTEKYGNPSSVHSFGRDVRDAIDEARNQIAIFIGASTKEVYFTSGGTESDNLAIMGLAYSNRKKGNHIITTSIEHHAILHTCEFLKKQGFEVTYLPVDEHGMVRLCDLEAAIKDTTILISIMFANNEVGTIQPIKEIGALAREKGIRFHSDAVAAAGSCIINVNECNIDMLTLTGHKFYAPKGIGALFIRNGINISPLLHGGAQERNLRAGTENVPGIVGLGKACEIMTTNFKSYTEHVTILRNRIIKGILNSITDVKLNGHPIHRVPGNANFSFAYVEGESLILNLDLKGIAVSSGSACASGSIEPSHVLLAMGLSHEEAHGSLRITLGHENTVAEVDYFLEILPEIVTRLRSMSPLHSK